MDFKKVFGEIKPPDEIKHLTKDPTGSEGISIFLTSFVQLIYSLAAVMLLIMLIWGAWDWMTSEGEKDKLQQAQRKLVNAMIGMGILAGTFAILQLVGRFTGFKFFVGQT